MSFILIFLLISFIMVSLALLDHVYNDGDLFFVREKKELTEALFMLFVPLVNILVVALVFKKHLKGEKYE